MYGLIFTLHVIVCVLMVIVVLIQAGKSAGMGGLFGGGGMDTLFSAPSGTTFIRKVTIGLAIGFVCTTLLLTILGNRLSTRSVIERVGIPGQQP